MYFHRKGRILFVVPATYTSPHAHKCSQLHSSPINSLVEIFIAIINILPRAWAIFIFSACVTIPKGLHTIVSNNSNLVKSCLVVVSCGCRCVCGSWLWLKLWEFLFMCSISWMFPFKNVNAPPPWDQENCAAILGSILCPKQAERRRRC